MSANIPDDEIQWCAEPIIGLVLVNAEIDSSFNPIDTDKYYRVGKHLPTGMLILIPVEGRSFRIEFQERMLRQQNRLN
jgi:hypothetical protein